MKDFKTSKGKQLFNNKNEAITIDKQFVYMSLDVNNMASFAKASKKIDINDETAIFDLATQIFTKESYELIKYLSIEDFVSVFELAISALEKEKDKLDNKFKRADQ